MAWQIVEDSSSSGFGFNVGGGVGDSGNGGNVNAGFNISSGDMHRMWTDNITTIKGTDGMVINTGTQAGSTGDLNLTGAAILSDNITLNVKGNTNKKDLEDSYYSESMSIGASTTIATGGNQPTVPGTGGKPNQFPGGQTSISGSYAQNESNRTTYATIGGLNSTLTSATKDVTGGDFEGSLTVDHRLLTDEGQQNIAKNFELIYQIGQNTTEAVIKTADQVYEKLFPSGISDPGIRNEVREAIRQAGITGDTETLKAKVKELTGKKPSDSDLAAIENLSTERDFAKLRNSFSSEEEYQKFAKNYILQVGIFFDGTGNNIYVDKEKGEETNVARMTTLYDSKQDPKYVTGIGTSGGLDNLCQGTGCGITLKQEEAQDYLVKKVINNNDNKNILFFPIDIISFSRGVTTGADFINKINNDNYWNLGIMPRSELMFDPVASYGIAGNEIDLGRDFSIPTNVIAIQINAANEQRNLFDLQSLANSDGKLASPNWTQITLPGVHADIGGGYANGYQGKTQDIALYSMQMVLNEAQKYGINFTSIPSDQQPSSGFNQLMSYYNQGQTNLNNNPNSQNQAYFNAISGLIKDISIHDSTFIGTGKVYNYSIGDQRGIFYPNDKYLNNSTTLSIQSNQ